MKFMLLLLVSWFSGKPGVPGTPPTDALQRTGTVDQGVIRFESPDLLVRVPPEWHTYLTPEAKKALPREGGEWDTEYDKFFDAILPRNDLLLHAGKEKFGKGVSFMDLHFRLYCTEANLEGQKERKHLGERLQTAIRKKARKAHVTWSKPKLSDQPTHKLSSRFEMWFHDYGSSAHVNVYLVRRYDITYVFCFCSAAAPYTELHEEIIQSFQVSE